MAGKPGHAAGELGCRAFADGRRPRHRALRQQRRGPAAGAAAHRAHAALARAVERAPRCLRLGRQGEQPGGRDRGLPAVPPLPARRPALPPQGRRLLSHAVAGEPRDRLGVALHAVVLGDRQLAGGGAAHHRHRGPARLARHAGGSRRSTWRPPAGCSAGTRPRARNSPMPASPSPTGRRRCSAASAGRACPRCTASGHSSSTTAMPACMRGSKHVTWTAWCCACCATTTAPIRRSRTSSPTSSPGIRVSTAPACASSARTAGPPSRSGSAARPPSPRRASGSTGRSAPISRCCQSASGAIRSVPATTASGCDQRRGHRRRRQQSGHAWTAAYVFDAARTGASRSSGCA